MTRKAVAAFLLFVIGPIACFADDASNPAYSSGWTNGSNGGTGFGPWNLISGPSNSGFFIGNSNTNASGTGPGINTSNVAWGMNASGGNFAIATRPFSTSLQLGESFGVSFDNGFIDNGSIVGFGLGDSTGTLRFNFQFTGGTSFYQIIDGGGTTNTSLGFTGGGLTALLTLTGTNSYSFTVTRLDTNANYLMSGSLGGTPSTMIDRFVGFNINAGSNPSNYAYFNSVRIFPVPEPASVLAICGLGGMAYGIRRRWKRA